MICGLKKKKKKKKHLLRQTLAPDLSPRSDYKLVRTERNAVKFGTHKNSTEPFRIKIYKYG